MADMVNAQQMFKWIKKGKALINIRLWNLIGSWAFSECRGAKIALKLLRKIELSCLKMPKVMTCF